MRPGWSKLGVGGNPNINSELFVTGNSNITGSLSVGNTGTINTATGDGDLYVEDALEVDGSICLGGVCETSWPAGSGGGGAPMGTVIYYNGTSCPSGYTEVPDARGRYLTGLTSGGTLGATVGTALSNTENRAVGQHSHSVDPPSTGTNSDSHSHSGTTSSGGSHSHSYEYDSGVGSLWGYADELNSAATTNSRQTGSSGSHSHSFSTNSDSHSHNVDIGSFTSGNSGSVAGTNAPYKQLLVCVKVSATSSSDLPTCADGQIAEYDTGSSGWICGDDSTGTPVAGTDIDVSGSTVSLEPVLDSITTINGAADHIGFMEDKADDTTYEWLGMYSGATRQGIMLWDGSWSGCNSRTNEFCLKAENGNHLALDASSDIVLMPGSGLVGIGTIAPAETLELATSTTRGAMRIYQVDDTTSDHIQFYNGATRVGEIGTQDESWLRINQVTNKNIYTPRYFRADNGLYVDGSTFGVTGSGGIVGNSFTYSSDESLKENISSLENSLDKITVLEGVSFTWKNQSYAEGTKLGFIAQDVEKVFPEVVQTQSETGLKSVEYGNLVAPLVEAVKEQQIQIEQLQKEVELLKKELADEE